MPKKIRRSNNRLKKTNRKVRKTANSKRLKKFVGGAKHWVSRVNGHYTIKQMTDCTIQIKDIISSEDTLFNKLLNELSQYLQGIIESSKEWEKKNESHIEQVRARRRRAREAEAAEREALTFTTMPSDFGDTH